MKRNYDIVVVGNMIGGRQGFAYVCNSGEITVLKADYEAKQEYEDFKEFCKVKVAWDYRGHESYHTCTMHYNNCDNKSQYEFTSYGACLSGSFGYHDLMKMIDESNLPIVRKDGIVAVAEYTSKTVLVKLFKVSKVSIGCSTAATLIPLNDEEMQEVVKNANRWLDR